MMMRDTRKDKTYFADYLEYQYSIIAKKTSKYEQSTADPEKQQRILCTLTNYEVDLLKAEFSYGASQDDLRTRFIHALPYISSYKNMTYDELLTFLSLAILLDAARDAKKLVSANMEMEKTDRLLHCFTAYINGNGITWDKSIPLNDTYALMDPVFTSGNKEDAMKKYLEHWYDRHEYSYWYDAHKRDTDTYCGYWSFEAGAVAEILKLDLKKLSMLEYFPVF